MAGPRSFVLAVNRQSPAAVPVLPDLDTRGRVRAGLDRGSGVLVLEPGTLDMDDLMPAEGTSLGLLVRDGLIAVELGAGRGHTAWLIGAEDLIRPWEMGEIALTRHSRWRVLTRARILPLRGAFYRRIQRDPVVLEQVLSRAARTSHWLLAKSLIASTPNVGDRLLLLFTLWGERWGRVTRDGVRLELPLTHELIATCCGAQRPTVTLAMRTLEDRGLVTRIDRNCWLLRRDLPAGQICEWWDEYRCALGLNGGNGHVVWCE